MISPVVFYLQPVIASINPLLMVMVMIFQVRFYPCYCRGLESMFRIGIVYRLAIYIELTGRGDII